MTTPPRLGRYELLEQLGEGGMGAVWLARLTGTGGFEKYCIVKTVLPAIAKDKQFVDRFLHEGRVLTQLQHSNIAQVYDMSIEAGTLFLALEYVPGVDLSRLQVDLTQQGKALPVSLAAYLIQQAAEGLGFAHRKTTTEGSPLNIVHRDVSPQNIMVSYEGEVKVIDFGIAKSEARSHATASQMVMGKLGYMAPEQALAIDVDHRADQYALAIVLWELLANQPFVPRGTMTEMLMAMAQPRPHPLSPLRPDVPPGLEQVVLKALSSDPADRFATTDEFARALLEELMRMGNMPGSVQLGEFLKSHCTAEYQQLRAMLTRVQTLRGPVPPSGWQPSAEGQAQVEPPLDQTYRPAKPQPPAPGGTERMPAFAQPAPAPSIFDAATPQANVDAKSMFDAAKSKPPAPAENIFSAAAAPAPVPSAGPTPFPDPFKTGAAGPSGSTASPQGPSMTTAELQAAAIPKRKGGCFLTCGVLVLAGVGAAVAGGWWFMSRGTEVAAPEPAQGKPGTPSTGAPVPGAPTGTAPGLPAPAGIPPPVAPTLAPGPTPAPAGTPPAPLPVVGAPTETVEVTTAIEVFQDGANTFVRGGTDRALFVGQSLDVVGPEVRPGLRPRLGRATVMEVFPSMARVALDGPAAAAPGVKAASVPRGAGGPPPVAGPTPTPPPSGTLPPGYGGTTPAPPPTGGLPPGYGGAPTPPPTGGLPPGYGNGTPQPPPPPVGRTPPPAGAAPFKAKLKLQRTPIWAITIYNISSLNWSNCSVYIPGGKRGELKSLSPGFSREMPLQYFTPDSAAPPLTDAVKIVCPQGSITLPATE